MTLRVYLSVKGKNPHALITRLGREGVRVWHVKVGSDEVSLECLRSDVQRVRAFIEQRGYAVAQCYSVGLGAWLNTVRARITLAVCALIALMMAAVAMSLVWAIHIEGAGAYQGEILLELEQAGVHALMPRSSLDLNALRDSLEWRLPRVKRVSVKYSGVALLVTVYEGVTPGEADTTQGSGDIVAQRDGIINRVLVYAGTAKVSRGDLVKKGQVLIEGVERGKEETLLPVRARGSVLAQVYDMAQAVVPVTELVSIPTGKSEVRTGVVTPFFALYDADAPAFLSADVSVDVMQVCGAFFPIYMKKETYIEVSLEQRERDVADVKREAGVLAMQKLAVLTVFRDDVIDKWVDYSMIDNDSVKALATAQRLCDIGVYCAK